MKRYEERLTSDIRLGREYRLCRYRILSILGSNDRISGINFNFIIIIVKFMLKKLFFTILLCPWLFCYRFQFSNDLTKLGPITNFSSYLLFRACSGVWDLGFHPNDKPASGPYTFYMHVRLAASKCNWPKFEAI